MWNLINVHGFIYLLCALLILASHLSSWWPCDPSSLVRSADVWCARNEETLSLIDKLHNGRAKVTESGELVVQTFMASLTLWPGEGLVTNAYLHHSMELQHKVSVGFCHPIPLDMSSSPRVCYLLTCSLLIAFQLHFFVLVVCNLYLF